MELFPPGVVYVSTTFDPDGDPRSFGVALPPSLDRAVPKRRVEFAAGRRCVRDALRQLDPALEHVEVGIGSQREPLFPAGVVGAISHGARIASAALASTRDMLGVGLDIEPWIAADALASVEETVLVEGESARLQRDIGWPASRVATVVFSAKETLYKCLFPAVRRYFDFKEAEVDAIDVAANRFRIRLLASLTAELLAGATFEGRMLPTEAVVITTMVRRAGS
jgi:enterobactin synthetase component D